MEPETKSISYLKKIISLCILRSQRFFLFLGSMSLRCSLSLYGFCLGNQKKDSKIKWMNLNANRMYRNFLALNENRPEKKFKAISAPYENEREQTNNQNLNGNFRKKLFKLRLWEVSMHHHNPGIKCTQDIPKDNEKKIKLF